ncbi:rhamnulokinase [Tissierellaceae bacterium HCP3S3_D8]
MNSNGSKKQVLAIDLGASSGRAILGTYDGDTIITKEVHRFSNDPVIVNDTMYWDILRLVYEIKQGLIKSKSFGEIDSIAVNTWGVDFGLLDKSGYLLENPVHYRDKRTEGMIEKSFRDISKEEFYDITGNQFIEINTVFQLLSLRESRKELLDRADILLMMPDLINYFLSGIKVTEETIASTTQLFDARKKTWSERIINLLGLPKQIFPDVVSSGTIIGDISGEIQKELGLKPIRVIAIAGHDTQSALLATPTLKKDFIFLSCGTWSLLGTELKEPIINRKSLNLNISNESAYKNKTSFLKNITGLWLIQESRRQWIREGEELSFSDLEELAHKAKSFRCFIDLDDPLFVEAGNIPKRIQEYCKMTGQYIPETKSEIVRCINESLALKYRLSLEEIESCTKKHYNTIHIVGGGAQSQLLCNMTASACNVEVLAGHAEATALGNICIQYIALGYMKNAREARRVIKNSYDIKCYYPEKTGEWDKAYERFKRIINK